MSENATDAADRAQLDSMLDTFFGAFTSGPDAGARLDALRSMFLPNAVIIRACGTEPVTYDVDGFLNPRAALLTGGALVGFREEKLTGRIDVFGDIAHWFGSSAKRGRQDGAAVAGRAMKSIQFVRTAQGWRISAAAWDDERDGVAIGGTDPPWSPS